MSAVEIAAALGGARRSGRWWSCRCPVHDDRSPSLSLCDGERGLVVRCWAGCDPRDVLAELRARGLVGGARTEMRPAPPGTGSDDSAWHIDLARRIWAAAKGAPGTPVARCLVGRGITNPPPPALRYVPFLRRPDGTSGPAMIARIDNVDGELIGISRTWLYRDRDGTWRRRNRAMLGHTAGGSVRLAPAAGVLLVGEGIESTLSGMIAADMPGWAALSTSGLVALVLPAIVHTVVILVDNDRSGAGERAARAAAARWLVEGRRVRLAMPPKPGMDFNDVLIGRPDGELHNVAA